MAVDAWEWLSLIDSDGPFLSRAALKTFYPTGLPKADASVDDVNATFVEEFTRWSKAWQSTDLTTYPEARDRWVEVVLRKLLDWSDELALAPADITAHSPNESVSVSPWALLNGSDGPVALVTVVDRIDNLRSVGSDGWSANEIDRMAVLLREAGVTIGLVTDGRWWALVSADKDVTTASGVWDALLWREERPSRDAFLALASFTSIAGGQAEKRLPLLFAESVASAEQITVALGDQVRRAVELVLQSMSDTHLRTLAQGDESPLPADPQTVYEGAVTVLMRIVFLLFAEERGLLPEHDLYRSSYAIAGVREKLQQQTTEVSAESLDHSWEAWHCLLAASNAVYGGASYEDMRMPAYGGSLFEPERFPWLQTRDAQGLLAVRLTDRAMLAVLRAVQTIEDGAMQLSFRDLDVEQIGYVYEGLLGYSAAYVEEVVVGLQGKNGFEPEVPLRELEEIAEAASTPADFGKLLAVHLKKTQEHSKPRTANQLAKAYGATDSDAAADARTRLRHTLLGDDELAARLEPFHGLIRDDLRGFPYVVPNAGLVMTESPQRANTGTHYTPRSLAEEVVLHALEPLVYSPGPLDTENSEDWILKSSAEILDLKVADIAAGSGAFLVAAARYLADRLLEARSNEGLTIGTESDAKRWAVREVVARCLYGADINGMAVEMCKLSLWLISMDPGKPFSFVDDRVFHGNSLLGVTTEAQLKAQHIYPETRALKTPLRWFDVDKDLEDIARLRRELASGQVDDADRVRSTRAKQALLKQSGQMTTKLRDIADGIIAAGLMESGKPGVRLEHRYQDLADALREAYPADGTEPNRRHLATIIEDGLTPTVAIGDRAWRPLHWIIETPDVFLDRDGFDAVVGNPPFLGGQKITAAMGTNVRDWLVNVLSGGKRGSADLIAYFLLRCSELSRSQLALIGTNSIAQGNSREVGVSRIIKDGWTIHRAIRSRPWPSKSANLEYAAIWCTNGLISKTAPIWIDGNRASHISALLEEGDDTGSLPVPLEQNRSLTFQGVIILGTGFILSSAERAALLDADPNSREVIHPYLGGEELNSSPEGTASRWVINFAQMSEGDARRYGPVFEHIERTIKPQRLAQKDSRARERWWQFLRPRPDLYDQIRGLKSVIAIAQVSSTLMPRMVTPRQVLDAKLVIFASDSTALLAFLSSGFHRYWAIQYGTTMRNDATYTPRTIFEPLPLPRHLDRLRSVGDRIVAERDALLVRLGIGLTPLYRRVDDPSDTSVEIKKIRELHCEIDQNVAEAYGWGDLDLGFGHHDYRGSTRFGFDPRSRIEVLRRLLLENRQYARGEVERLATPAKSTRGHQNLKSGEGAMF